MRVLFCNISWDTDGADVDLPEEVELLVEDDSIDIALEGANLLSDEIGWCVNSFQFQIL